MPNGATWSLPAELDTAVRATLREWTEQRTIDRIWARDARVWTGTDEASWLGWLGIVEQQRGRVGDLHRIAEDVRQAGFTHVLLLGMGGSSLSPEVLSLTFGQRPGCPELLILDSTDPAQIRATEARVNLERTLFVVSSKSGTTLEPNIFTEHFFARVQAAVGPGKVGDRFIAITDPGSKLEEVAKADGFRHVCYGVPSIGGRYSALSDFGLVPAALMGLDVARLLGPAEAMARACRGPGAADENPGAVLGVILGVLAARGRDKVTLIASPGIHDLGAWLEQLLAESTGKQGKGLIPVDREPLGPPEVYGPDRLLVYLRLQSAPDGAQDRAIASLQAAGQPVVRLDAAEPYQIGAEFFRWEFATAVAGAILGINAFDQPDVEASKVATRRLTDEFERTGRLPAETPFLEVDGARLYADPRNAGGLAREGAGTLTGVLGAHLGRLRSGDYAALLAYVPMTAAHETVLQRMRTRLRDRRRVATCVGFGPRFLHSTGQAYKGGPNTGVFLQITCDDADDVPVPGQRYTFGVVKAAQARGDFEVLATRGRRALRVHLGRDVAAGLARLTRAVDEAVQA
jgi:transaldolase / glucose-6-phosphate isomerase